jgi:hypothetical protein
MIKFLAMVFTSMLMDIDMKDIGKIIKKMELGKYLLMIV